jgi:phenylalanyl-tRNA synthetase beta chain
LNESEDDSLILLWPVDPQLISRNANAGKSRAERKNFFKAGGFSNGWSNVRVFDEYSTFTRPCGTDSGFRSTDRSHSPELSLNLRLRNDFEMKISCNWLREYVNTGLEPVEIARILTDCGLEVEAIEEYESLRGGLKGVVIGHVLSAERHPNADKLTCCKVDVGGEKILDIVCGAPNVAAGQKVPVATIGTVIYNGDESFTIKAGKIRGELSEGMICAEDELGLGDSHAGIMVLDPGASVGTPAAAYFGITTDTVLEVAITPNRADATSHIGVARDLAAAINNREKQHSAVALVLPAVAEPTVSGASLPVSVSILNPEACSRYTGITLTGLQVKESPAWLRDRLKAVGLRPINNIVDITNYVLMETGQPLHAFDVDSVTGRQVIVRKLPAGTPFVTLDEVERKLGADDLMICNAEEPMCIAGVFGGAKSGVTERTTSVFLESAYFDGTHVRKTSKLHGLKTDASFRFERGSDPNMTVYALRRAVALMQELAGASVASAEVDVYPEPIADKEITVSLSRMNTLIGKAIPRDTVRGILVSLGIGITGESEDELRLSIPPFKVDVTREADIVEEVLRIYGYNNIDFSDSLHSSLSFSRKPDPEAQQQKLSDYLSSNGFSEILTNSLTSSAYYEKSEIFPFGDCVKILNPLSSELGVMRQTLLFSGLESLAYNLNRRMPDLKFYEFGNVYTYLSAQAGQADVTRRYSEKKKLSVLITGAQQPESWYAPSRKADHTYLKSVIFPMLSKSGISLNKLVPAEADNRIFAEGEAFTLNGKAILTLGRLNQSILRMFDIRQDVFYADLDWESLMREIRPGSVRFSEIPRFPEVRRDLALLLNKDVLFRDIETAAFRNGKGILRSVNLFDVYEGEKIEAGKKSYAVSFTLQDDQKTLTDTDIEKIMKRITEALEKETGAVVRK